jgi:hypothetical protein
MSHRVFDHLLFALLVVAPVVEWRWTWPRFLARLAARVPQARLGYYRTILLEQWALVACLLTAWTIQRRQWGAILLDLRQCLTNRSP